MSLPFAQIRAAVGDPNLLTAPEELHCYSFDASKMRFAPEAVAFPGNVAEVCELIKLANRHRFAVYPRGSGSGMVGACLAQGGLVIVTNRLKSILEIDADNMTAVLEPGVITGEFQEAVARYGLFYPPDPASLPFATMGGNVATCAGGPRAVKYGVTRDYLLGLEVVLPTGEVVRTGTRTMKGVVGYDMTRLMAGSEGTLGIFTKIIVRLIPAPESIRTLTAVFPVLDDAAQAVCEILRNRIIPSTMELMDQATIRRSKTIFGSDSRLTPRLWCSSRWTGQILFWTARLRESRRFAAKRGQATPRPPALRPKETSSGRRAGRYRPPWAGSDPGK